MSPIHNPDPRRFQKSLSLLRGKLTPEEKKVFDALPRAETLSFPSMDLSSTSPNASTQRTLYLGLRPLSDPTKFAQEYATLHEPPTNTPNTKQAKEPRITYAEREFSSPTYPGPLQFPQLPQPPRPFQPGTVFYKRHPISLLRRPHLLDPPFCFLYFNSSSRTERRNIKYILTALILYYCAASGRSRAAFMWKEFRSYFKMGMRILGETRDWWAWVEGQGRRRRGEGGRLNEIAKLVVPEEGEEDVLVDVEEVVNGEG